MSAPILHTTPEDPTPDAGPRRHGGPGVILAALMAALAALYGAGLAQVAGRPDLLSTTLMLFIVPALWWGRCAWVFWRDRTPLPRSHSVLVGMLGFDLICTCRGVASTVFFHPDRAAAGGDLELFVFMENYTSRRRVVELCIGPHRGLGLATPHHARLHLAAGQAAVYHLTLRASSELKPGQHDLPVSLRAHGPAGVGRRLPNARGQHLYDLWHTRFAAPFEMEAAATVSAATDPLPPPVYLSLATVGEPRPHLHALQELAVPGWLKSRRTTS